MVDRPGMSQRPSTLKELITMRCLLYKRTINYLGFLPRTLHLLGFESLQQNPKCKLLELLELLEKLLEASYASRCSEVCVEVFRPKGTSLLAISELW